MQSAGVKNVLIATRMISTLTFVAISGCLHSRSPIASSGSDRKTSPEMIVTLADSLSWRPDGSAIAYLRVDYRNGVPVRRAVEVRSLRDLAVTVQSNGTWDATPTWVPDGSRIVFSRAHGADVLLCVRMIVKSSIEHLITKSGRSWVARPAGCWIGLHSLLFFAKAKSGGHSIYIWNEARDTISELWQSNGDSIYPVASPDGRLVAYITAPTKARTLHIASLSGSPILTCTHGAVFDMCWTRQGDGLIYLTTSKGECSLRRVDLASRKDVLIGSVPVLYSPMSINSNGVVAVGGTDTHGLDSVFLFDTRGASEIATSPGSVRCLSPSWSPDGSELAFIERVGDGFKFRVMAASDIGRSGWKVRK